MRSLCHVSLLLLALVAGCPGPQEQTPASSEPQIPAQYATGAAALAAGDAKGAMALFRECFKHCRGEYCAPCLKGMSQAYHKLGNPRLAARWYKRYLDVAPPASRRQ